MKYYFVIIKCNKAMLKKYPEKIEDFISDQIKEVKKRGIIDKDRIKHYLNYRFRSLRDYFKSNEEGFKFYNKCLKELNNIL